MTFGLFSGVVGSPATFQILVSMGTLIFMGTKKYVAQASSFLTLRSSPCSEEARRLTSLLLLSTPMIQVLTWITTGSVTMQTPGFVACMMYAFSRTGSGVLPAGPFLKAGADHLHPHASGIEIWKQSMKFFMHSSLVFPKPVDCVFGGWAACQPINSLPMLSKSSVMSTPNWDGFSRTFAAAAAVTMLLKQEDSTTKNWKGGWVDDEGECGVCRQAKTTCDKKHRGGGVGG
mmetsp:Transcript_44290/g.111586  ORF Transcript_44290/g.111586 Transcript_44290/m.111586 type:complete len:231 (-) Transcript_44290:24-716(-)